MPSQSIPTKKLYCSEPESLPKPSPCDATVPVTGSNYVKSNLALCTSAVRFCICPGVNLQLAKSSSNWTRKTFQMNSNHSKPSLHLLRLPYELRYEIWVYTLGGNTFEIQCWPSDGPSSIATQITVREKNQCSLLQTCRQIHNEAKLTFFKSNCFKFKNEDAISPWLARIGSRQQAAISEICLVTWGAAHMIQGHSSCLTKVSDVLPFASLPGLRNLFIEIRQKARCRSCWHNCCRCCWYDVEREKVRLKDLVFVRNSRTVLTYIERDFGSAAAAHLL